MKTTPLYLLRLMGAFCLLSLLACQGRFKQNVSSEAAHPMLIKTLGGPHYGNVACSLLDQEGTLWFGTTENGLYAYDGNSFKRYLKADGLNSNQVSCLMQDKKGLLWIGTSQGLCCYDGKRFTQVEIPLPPYLAVNKNTLYKHSKMVFNILQAKNGMLWLATIAGVFRYDGQTFSHFAIDTASLGYMSTQHNVEYMLEDANGNMWFGGRNNQGVYTFDGHAITKVALPALSLQFKVGNTDSVKTVVHDWAWPQLLDKKGHLWFSNWAGLYRYDGKTFTTYTNKDGIPGNNGLVAKVIEDQQGKIWVGGDGGLASFDGQTFTSYKDGLENPWIWTITEDAAGKLWVGTRATGLYCFDGKSFENYAVFQP